MIAAPVLSLLLLAAPEDAAERLRIAWASQYEWREDGVENATLDFRYRYHWRSSQDEEQQSEYEGRAQVVVVGREIVRSHFPGAPGRREQFQPHVEWVLGRFARAPFDEQFKGMSFKGPEPTDDGLERITVLGEKTLDIYVLSADRLAGREWPLREPGRFNRQTYTVRDLGGGYAVLREQVSWDLGERGKSGNKRELTTGKGERHPYPETYRYVAESPGGVITIELDFEPPTVNAEHPVVGDPAARDLLEAAWGRRYALPRDLRFEADFQRRIDNQLGEAYWYRTVKGKLQIWGLDDVQFMLDEGVIYNPDATYLLKQRLREHFEWLVWLLGEKAFAREFERCGFVQEDGDERDGTIVRVLGHTRVLAFRVEDGRIVGHLENAAEADRWWSFHLKKVKDDRARIQSLTVMTGGQRHKLGIRYARKGGFDVPVEFEAIGRGYSERGERCGVAKFRFKRVKVSRPE